MFFFLQTNVKETIEPPIKKLEPKLLPGEFILYIIQKAGNFMQFSVCKFAGLGRHYIKTILYAFETFEIRPNCQSKTLCLYQTGPTRC